MTGSLRRQLQPSMLFLIASILFAVARVLVTHQLPPTIAFVAFGHDLELSWLGIGVLVCLLYAILYYVSAKFLNVCVSLGRSLLHLVITLSALFGLGQKHYIGIRTDQSPATYNSALALLGANAFPLLLFGGLLFFAFIMRSWVLKLVTSH